MYGSVFCYAYYITLYDVISSIAIRLTNKTMKKLLMFVAVAVLAAGVAWGSYAAASSGMHQSLSVNNGGVLQARADVTAVDSSSVTLSVWGAMVKVRVSDSTKLTAWNGRAMALADVKVGDNVMVRGKIVSGAAAFTIDASRVRDYARPPKPSPTPSPSPVVNGDGFLRGHVSIGPICPVEREDHPCRADYANTKVVVYNSASGAFVSRTSVAADGSYIVELAPGTYRVDLETNYGFMHKNLPQIVTVEANEATKLNISLDTGIR